MPEDFFSLFFCKRTEKEEFDLQTSAANFAALLLNFYCLNILSCFCFLQLGVFFYALKLSPNEEKSMFLKKICI